MPKLVFSMKRRKSLCQKYSKIESVGWFMYIFTECRKDLCKKWYSLQSVGRVCVKNTAILRVWDDWAFMYIFTECRKDLNKKMVFSMKCRKSLCQKYGKIKSVGWFMYIFMECRKDLCKK